VWRRRKLDGIAEAAPHRDPPDEGQAHRPQQRAAHQQLEAVARGERHAEPDGFWARLTEDYLRLLRAMQDSPEASALLRGWLGGAGSPSLRAAQHDAEQEILPWVTATLAAGRRIGAVRSDLPAELLMAVVMGIGQAIDVWVITRPPDDSELERTVGAVFGMMRRALEPPG
jgi:hypothetical protein